MPTYISVAKPWAVLLWATEYGKDGLFHKVSHELKLAGPGLATAQIARRSARLLALREDNYAAWQKRYAECFGGAT